LLNYWKPYSCDNDPSLSLEQRQARLEPKIQALPVLQDPTGLRVDISLEDPTSGEHKLVDVTITHSTAASYLAKEFSAVSQRYVSNGFASTFNLPDFCGLDPSPLLVQKEKEKTEKYSRLLMVTNKQYAKRMRRQAPVFAPFALSNNGELGQAASSVQEWVVGHYRKHIIRGPQSMDGITIAARVHSFRHNTRISVLAALLAGFGATLNAAGQACHRY
jgi:hypothetical protein